MEHGLESTVRGSWIMDRGSWSLEHGCGKHETLGTGHDKHDMDDDLDDLDELGHDIWMLMGQWSAHTKQDERDPEVVWPEYHWLAMQPMQNSYLVYSIDSELPTIPDSIVTQVDCSLVVCSRL